VHFFCRQFKAFTGRTPGTLRETAQRKAEAATAPVTPEDIAQYRLFSFK
jgi:acetylornithine/succinyldiaminopimelate/putrescine aminotransferase